MSFLRLPLIIRLRQTLSPNYLSSLDWHSTGSVSLFSSGSGSIEINISDEESRRRLNNRLLYRSRQRGFLELDLILGKWVEENLASMDEAKIRSLVEVLDLENPDLWKWLSGQEQPPDVINSNTVEYFVSKISFWIIPCPNFRQNNLISIQTNVFSSIQSKVLESLNTHAAPATRAEPGRPWVRGWDDKRGLEGGPMHGNQ